MIAQRTPDHLLPQWPADAFDDRPLPLMETLTVPPGNRKVTVCDDWPDCGCIGDCELRFLKTGGSERMLAFVLIALGSAAAVAFLFWLGLRA